MFKNSRLRILFYKVLLLYSSLTTFYCDSLQFTLRYSPKSVICQVPSHIGQFCSEFQTGNPNKNAYTK